MSSPVEKCQNPWKEEKCPNADVEVYIVIKKEKLAICKECWLEIVESNKQWSENDV